MRERRWKQDEENPLVIVTENGLRSICEVHDHGDEEDDADQGHNEGPRVIAARIVFLHNMIDRSNLLLDLATALRADHITMEEF